MIILKNLSQPKTMPAVFSTEEEFIKYTIDEATWNSLPTGEIPTMEKWGFTKVIDNTVSNEYGKKEDIYHWEAALDTCTKFWNENINGWSLSFN